MWRLWGNMIFVLTCVWSRVYYRVPDSALKLVEGLFMETEVRYEIFNFFSGGFSVIILLLYVGLLWNIKRLQTQLSVPLRVHFTCNHLRLLFHFVCNVTLHIIINCTVSNFIPLF